MSDWKPDLYLEYNRQRSQPVTDLVNRIDRKEIHRILDFGCGPGNSTVILRKKWPDAEITGIDSSESMIAAAKAEYPDMEWQVKNILDLEEEKKYDLVFSNAVIQWIKDHNYLLKKLGKHLNSRGTLAFQIPLYDKMEISAVIDEEYHKLKPEDSFSISSFFEFHGFNYYYKELCGSYANMEIWETDYVHEMSSYEDIIRMIESTGLKPYAERIGGEDTTKLFKQNILSRLKGIYATQDNSKVLFPFKRLFVTGQKK